jgi:hypothetical protein
MTLLAWLYIQVLLISWYKYLQMQNVLWWYDILSVSSNTRDRNEVIGIKEDLVYIWVPYLQYIIEEVWVLIKGHMTRIFFFSVKSRIYDFQIRWIRCKQLFLVLTKI